MNEMFIDTTHIIEKVTGIIEDNISTEKSIKDWTGMNIKIIY